MKFKNMKLIDVKLTDKTKAIEKLETIYNPENLDIIFWADEYCRDQGEADIYIMSYETVKEAIDTAKYIVYKDDFACAEVWDIDGDLLYFYDYEDELILV